MSIELLATVILGIALIHSFATPVFARLAQRKPFYHYLAEVELVFGLWATVFMIAYAMFYDFAESLRYASSLSWTEPFFVFCVMIIASTRAVVTLARRGLLYLVHFLAKSLPIDEKLIQVFVILGVGPLLGSVITEPAAITILALLLYRMLDGVSEKLLYAVLALLFVNVSIGGGLTHFAAPPILVVAKKFGWGISDVFLNIGLASMGATLLNGFIFCLCFKNRITTEIKKLEAEHYPMPWWITFVHLCVLVSTIVYAHYSTIFLSLFIAFVIFVMFTKKFQDGLKYREAYLVAFFLAGLIVLGSLQKWWIEPVLSGISSLGMYFIATALTAVTDNAALTYIGSQVPTLSESTKWALVSGAVTGGGLTILANAPNPAGFSVLAEKFPQRSLHAGKLLVAAFFPTLIAILFFMVLGNF